MGLSHMARDHMVLSRRFYAVAKEIRSTNRDPESIRKWHRDVLDIYSDEPEVFHALNAECHNAVAQAVGSIDRQEVTIWRHVLRNWVRFSPTNFPERQLPLHKPV